MTLHACNDEINTFLSNELTIQIHPIYSIYIYLSYPIPSELSIVFYSHLSSWSLLAISHATVEMKEPAAAPGETGHAYVDPGAWDTPNHWFFGDEKNAPKRVFSHFDVGQLTHSFEFMIYDDLWWSLKIILGFYMYVFH